MMGPANTKAFLGESDCQVVAACDLDTKHLQEALDTINEQYGNKDCKGYHDYHELLARESEGGQQFLASPIDKGFNRLAWLVPYSLAGTGVFALGFAAYRWSRRKDQPSAADLPRVEDPALDQRLDDELRDLD